MFQIQIILGLLASAVITGGWWFAAIRLRQHWTLYALAAVSTISLFLSATLPFMAVALSSHQAVTTGFTTSFSVLSGAASALGVMNALFFALFIVWLVSHVPSSRNA
jgi:bacteriorhodopsin